MSLQSWKEEFYPISAREIAKIVEDRESDISTKSKIELVEHSLRKWEGNKSKNLRKHKMRKDWSNSIEDEYRNYFEVDSSSCSLCKVFHERGNGSVCEECPLSIARGGLACDEDDDSGGSPWHRSRRGNPQNMILWLNKTKDMLEGKYIPKKKKD